MIEAIIYCGAGFLFAALIGIAVAPVIHSRAVRLTMRRLENSIPQSMAEIQADKDLLRAEFALSMHRLERGAEMLQGENTSQLAELGRKSDVINRFMIEREAQKVEAIALKTELDTLRDRLRTASKEIKAAGGRHHSDDLVALVPEEWPAAEEPRVAREGSDFSAELQATIPATPVSAHKFGNQSVNELSIGGRISRSLAYFSIAVLIGAGAAFAWLLYGDDAKEMVGARIPSLGRLLSVSTTKRPSDVATKPADPAATQDDSAVLTQEELAQQLENDLDPDVASVQHGDEEQVAAKQEQTTQDLAMRQVEQNTKQAMPSPSTQDQSILAGPETTIADWTLREVINGTAILRGPIGILRVTRGETVPGLGKITSIVRWGNGWVVATSAGYCTSAPPNYVDGICKPYRGN